MQGFYHLCSEIPVLVLVQVFGVSAFFVISLTLVLFWIYGEMSSWSFCNKIHTHNNIYWYSLCSTQSCSCNLHFGNNLHILFITVNLHNIVYAYTCVVHQVYVFTYMVHVPKEMGKNLWPPASFVGDQGSKHRNGQGKKLFLLPEYVKVHWR